MNQSFQNQLFKLRSVFPIPFYIFCMLFGQFNWTFFLSGLIIILIGEWIRFYSVGFIGKMSRNLEHPIANVLIISGPYQWIRNPIYTGNILIYLGFTLLSNVFLPYFPVVTVLVFWINYSMIIRFEEKFLAQAFGNEYDVYRESVNRWIPVFRKSFPPAIKFNAMTALHSEKSTLYIMIFALLLITLRMCAGTFQIQ